MTQQQTNEIPAEEKLHRSTYDPRAGHTLPTHGDYAQTLAIASSQGVLSTIDREDGTPYGSIVELTPLPNGDFIFLISNMASHTKNLKHNGACSLLIAEGFGEKYALSLSRATFMGTSTIVKDPQEHREAYLKLHPEASIYIDFPDFNFYRLHVNKVRYIGGFGRMSWLEQDDYANASPDPLWKSAAHLITHMNDDHQGNMRDYAAAFAELPDVDEITMDSVDRFGFEMRAQQGGRGHTVRISFAQEVSTSKEVRQELVALAQKARDVLGDKAHTQHKKSSHKSETSTKGGQV